MLLKSDTGEKEIWIYFSLLQSVNEKQLSSLTQWCVYWSQTKQSRAILDMLSDELKPRTLKYPNAKQK